MKTLQNGLTAKQTMIGLCVIALVALIAITFSSQPTAQAKEEYIAISPTYQTQLDNFEKDVLVKRCELTKKLAGAKLEDDMNGVKFDSIDRNALAEKRDADCSF